MPGTLGRRACLTTGPTFSLGLLQPSLSKGIACTLVLIIKGVRSNLFSCIPKTSVLSPAAHLREKSLCRNLKITDWGRRVYRLSALRRTLFNPTHI